MITSTKKRCAICDIYMQLQHVIQDHNIHKSYGQTAVLKTHSTEIFCTPLSILRAFPNFNLFSIHVQLYYLPNNNYLSQLQSFFYIRSVQDNAGWQHVSLSTFSLLYLNSLITQQSAFYTHHKCAAIFHMCTGFFFLNSLTSNVMGLFQ